MEEKYSEEQIRLQNVLTGSHDLRERIAAARNPNTPIDALIKVARHTPNEDRLVIEAANATISFTRSSSIFNHEGYKIDFGMLSMIYFQELSSKDNKSSDLKASSAMGDEQYINENILNVPRKFKDNTARSFTISVSEGYESYYFQISVPKQYGTEIASDDARKMLEDKLQRKSDMESIKLLVTGSYNDSDTLVIAAVDVNNERAAHIFRTVTLIGMKMYFKYEFSGSKRS